MRIPEQYAARLQRLRREMKAKKLSALLVVRPENRRYLSGYSAADAQLDESSGYLFITLRRQFLLTDFRYEIQAGREAVGYEVVIYREGPARTIARLAASLRVKRLGFEDDLLTVKAYKRLRGEMKGRALVPASGLIERLRAVKDKTEVRLLTRAARITGAALSQTLDFLRPGQTEIEVARYLEDSMAELGADGPAFESIVASGPNAALPHAVPARRKIKAGETIIFDCGARFHGYGADMSRTIILGRAKPWLQRIYTLVRQAQAEAISGLRPGLTTDKADALARDIIEAAGYGPQFGHALGHGVGLATHEAPSLSRARPVSLTPGMVVTVEPGIYIKGRGGVRLEDMVLITDTGTRLLTKDRNFYSWLAG